MHPKVLILIDTAIIGGPGKGLFQLLKHSPELDYILCNFRYKNPKSTEFIDYARNHGIQITLLSQDFRFDPRPVQEISRLVRSEKVEIIQTHGYKGHLIAALLYRWLKIRWLAVAHGWTSEDWKVKIYHSLDRMLLPWADHVVTVSTKLQESIAAWRPGRPTELILNAVEEPAGGNESAAAARSRIRAECGASSDEILLGCFGRLSNEKGQAILLEAFSGLPEGAPRARLLFLGDGPDRAKLEAQACALRDPSLVQFLGHKSDLHDYYAAIDLLILPSLSEGLPNVVLEAMVSSVPVLSTDVGSVREIITDGQNGWLVKPGVPAAISGRLPELLSKPLLEEMGRTAKASLFPKFCPRVRAERFQRIYRSLASSGAQ